MSDLDNLTAWAITQGYDPDVDYSDFSQPEPDEPETQPPAALPPGYLSPSFKASEFACHHCGQLPPGGMNPALIDALQAMRDHYGVPITINSGYRCPTHNAAIGGASNSQHMKGTAADIVVRGISPAQLYTTLDPAWPGGLGKYNTFTHVDVRGSRARWAG